MFGNLGVFELKVLASIIGLFVTLCLEPVVVCLKKKAIVEVKTINAPEGIQQNGWDEVIKVPKAGGMWLGRLERVMFFYAFWLDQPLIIGGWLVFKATAKWEVWTNIVNVPDKIDDVNDVDFLRARHKWGARVLQGFLVGTAANVLAGLTGVFVSKLLIGGW